ncbi:20611_t:CDS:2, partial [Gigaspora rosea]
PDRTLESHYIARRKVGSEYISIALYANANSSYKLNPLVIGKYQKPRCLKGKNINQNIESEIDNLAMVIENLNFSDPIKVEKFLNIPNKNFVYEVSDNNYAIAELVEIFKNNNNTASMYLLQQDNT